MKDTREEFITENAYTEFVKDLVYYGQRIQTLEFMADKDIWFVTTKSWTSQVRTTHIYHLG